MLKNNPEPTAANRAILNFGPGSLENGFPNITASIWTDNHRFPISIPGQLPPAPELCQLLDLFQANLQAIFQSFLLRRLNADPNQITNISIPKCRALAEELRVYLNNWLDSSGFLRIVKTLYREFDPDDEVLAIAQTQDIRIQQLPLHSWQFFEDYPLAAIALGGLTNDRIAKSRSARTQIRVLVIFGDDTGIDLGCDREELKNLPGAAVKIVEKPTRQQLYEQLFDPLGYDILYYGGHSSSLDNKCDGTIFLNSTEKLAISELKTAIKKAVQCGALKVCIFNSCDGLGIGNKLTSFNFPQAIIMKYPIPDLVAHKFLKYFIQAFVAGKSSHIAMREAREKLEGLEDRFIFSSWLPVMFQNLAELPINW